MRRTAPLLAVLVVLLAACGGRPVAHSSPPPTSAPTQTPASSAQPAGPLIAVLNGGSIDARPNTVSIVGVDGHTVATATFQPLKLPVVGMAATRLQSEAQVGASGVYNLDGSGVVRLLRPSGQSSVLTTFPMTPVQHEVWYAVSQGGDRLLAGVLTLPAVQPPGPGQPSWPPTLVGSYKFDLGSAQAGGQATVLKHLESPLPAETSGANWHVTFPVGWIQSGPVAMVDAPIATQNIWYGGSLYTIATVHDGPPARRNPVGSPRG